MLVNLKGEWSLNATEIMLTPFVSGLISTTSKYYLERYFFFRRFVKIE